MAFSLPEPQLADGVVTLRPFGERDLPLLERASADPDVVSAFGRSESASDALAFHRRRWEDGTAAAFVICPHGSASAGGVLLEPREVGRADIGYWLLAASRGRGYASRATRLIAEWALRDLDIARVQLLDDARERAFAACRGAGRLQARRCPWGAQTQPRTEPIDLQGRSNLIFALQLAFDRYGSRLASRPRVAFPAKDDISRF